MSDQRPIQRYTGGAVTGGSGSSNPVGSVMTAQGPAIIQVIDMPTGLGPVNASSSNSRRKPGGINVIGAVVRRWWLVLVVFVIVGGGAYFAGANLVKPQYSATAKDSFVDNNPDASGVGPAYRTIHRGLLLINAKEIVLKAATDTRLRTALPKIYGGDVEDPAQAAAIVASAQGMVEIPPETLNGTGVLDIVATGSSAEQASAVANAYANSLVWWCTKEVSDFQLANVASLETELKEGQAHVQAVLVKKAKLLSENNFDALSAQQTAFLNQITGLTGDLIKAQVAAHGAEAQVAQLENLKVESAGMQLKRMDIIKAEKERDLILKNLLDNLGTATVELSKLRALGMTDDHPSVKAALEGITRVNQQIIDREGEIQTIMNKRLDDQFSLESRKTVEEAKLAMNAAEGQLKALNLQLTQIKGEAGKLAVIREQVNSMDADATDFINHNREINATLMDLRRQFVKNPVAVFKVVQPGVATLKEDKRIKVQAGGLVGGLFLGILLALLVDKFDKRLRDPRDIEPLFGTPLLGCIPRIQELKKIKGDQARNLIAEEFRIIRTQVLFGNPNLSHKLIAITSPTPGDGKTSLAVNLAISVAKAGRRVLLIDGDLRKPDVHRVFNLADSPGFAELIQGSHEPGAVIKKSEIEGLEILPAGTPMTRPSELLSRPEMARLLVALGELYDHIVMDTAPLLPVSDSHVLAGMVDAVIVSFNAEVDRDVVTLTQDILRRSRANVIGTVMNQVKYRQSGSYQRGKTAYDSYYNSPRGAPRTADAKNDKLATITK